MPEHESIGAVVIGRNEGERLRKCLTSLLGQIRDVVYVDSGSTDGSADMARQLGVQVVDLDTRVPFSMARGRNAGAKALREQRPALPYLQFVDGDCEVDHGWMPAALRYLEENPGVVAVCGRRRERFPGHSIYNRICDIEWNTPPGPARACGGDALMRAAAFHAVGGFNEALIAGEEPELCLRLREAGGTIFRLDAEMTRHDANILTFRAWWRRTLRGGYGAADVVRRLRDKPAADIPFRSLVRGAPVWSAYWLGATVLPALILGPWWLAVGAAAWLAQAGRIARSVRHRAPTLADALVYGLFTMIGKWAQLAGILRYHRDVRAGKIITLIEYK